MFRVDGPVNLNRLMSIPDAIDRPDLKFDAFTADARARAGAGPGPLRAAAPARRDIVLHHPYESYEPVVELVRQAASDPNVLAIKQTLYRTGDDSVFVSALTEASRAGKDVTVVIELRARFDEANNIALATRLQEAGIQVVYGVVGFKTHAKMLLVVRREKRGPGALRPRRHGQLPRDDRAGCTPTSALLSAATRRVTGDIARVFLQLTGLGQTLDLTDPSCRRPSRCTASCSSASARETEISRAAAARAGSWRA